MAFCELGYENWGFVKSKGFLGDVSDCFPPKHVFAQGESVYTFLCSFE